MASQNDFENEPVFVIYRAVEKLRGPDMTDLDWEVLAGEIDAISLDRSAPGVTLDSKFALKDFRAAICNRDQTKAITEAELAFMVWG